MSEKRRREEDSEEEEEERIPIKVKLSNFLENDNLNTLY
jgi:hypothetical protein